VNSNSGLRILVSSTCFPTNPLIKTYDALCESCRSIVSLQLLFLENFNLVGTFWSLGFLKPGKWNENRVGRHSRVVHVCEPSACPPRVVTSALRRTDPRSRRGGPCTVVPPPLFSSCVVLTRGLAPSQGHAPACEPACTSYTHAPGQLAPACRPRRISLSLSRLRRRQLIPT
jgi:hypothetical protein